MSQNANTTKTSKTSHSSSSTGKQKPPILIPFSPAKKMSNEDDNSPQISLSLAEEEAHRLKTLAEQNYASKNLKFALKHAKRALKLHPSLDGVEELLTAFKIIQIAASPVFSGSPAPDYYKILDVERFSNINLIKKQYKKLALILHPDKSAFVACEEAFKFVGEAVRVLSDKIRRKEYDMRLRIGMEAEAGPVEGGVVGVELFRAECLGCRSLHEFERKYLGHDLVCPSCSKSFKAVEVEAEEDCANTRNVGGEEGVSRVSARIREKVVKGGKLGTVEKFGVGCKRKISSVGDVVERSGVKVARNEVDDGVLLKDLRLKTVEKSGGSDNGGIKVYQSRRQRKAMNADSSGDPGSSNKDVMNESTLGRVGRKDGAEVDEEEDLSGGIGIAVSERAKRAKARGEETMTLAQMQILAKKNKVDEGKLMVKEKEVNQNLTPRKKEEVKVNEKKKEKETWEGKKKGKEKAKGKVKENIIEKEKDDRERETEDVINLEIEDDWDIMLVEMKKEKEKKNDKNIEREKEKEKEKESGKKNEEMEKEKGKQKETETLNLKEKYNLRRVSKDGNSEVETSDNHLDVEIESDLEPVEKEKDKEEDQKEKQKQMANTRERRERRRVSKYSNLQFLNERASEDHIDSEIERLRSLKKSNLEIMPVEDSDFHDFDKDRRERSFKVGQVWAVYDEDDGMPRHYALINKVISVNPFEVTLSWLQFQSNGDEELISWEKKGFNVSCGKFKVSREVSVKYLNLFSHIADCDRVAREVYMSYPKKGSVWALYYDNVLDNEGKNKGNKDKRRYDIVVSLSSYSDIHGLSVAYLVKVDGFRAVFKRKEIGVHAVMWLGKEDMKLFSHQIPAKKLSGEEASGLPKDCWELDPASLTPQLLARL